MALPRDAPRPEKLPLASDVIKEYVKPHHTVVAVGCNDSPRIDPSALYAGTLLTTGRLLLLDNQSHITWWAAGVKLGERSAFGKTPARRLVEIHENTYGDAYSGNGDNVAYRQAVQKLRTRGMRVKLPVPVWGDIRKNNLPTGGADVLIDHGTLEFVLSMHADKQKLVGQALAEHLRVLKPGGKALVFGRDDHFADLVERAFA